MCTKWCVKSVGDEYGEVVGTKFLECVPRGAECDVRCGERNVGGCWLCVYVEGFACWCIGVVEYYVCVKLCGDCVGSCVCLLCGEPGRVVSVEVPQDKRVSEGIQVF